MYDIYFLQVFLYSIITLSIITSLIGCGVKGLPQPPSEPPAIGVGYKGWVNKNNSSTIKKEDEERSEIIKKVKPNK